MKKSNKTKIAIGGSLSAVMAVASVVGIVSSGGAFARSADDISKEIKALESQISEANSKADSLNQTASTLQGELDSISNQRKAIEAEIQISKAQYEKLQLEIKETEKSIETNRRALGETLANMSVEEDVTPLERLAGSEKISKALDSLEYQSSLKDSLTKKVNEIKSQKKRLEEKRDAVKKVLSDQQASEKQLQAKIVEQNKLIEQTKGDEAEYRKYAEAQNSQKSKLQAEQAELILQQSRRNASSGTARDLGVAGDGYSWGGGCVVNQSTQWSNIDDPLGYGCGQCVSYTAWRIYKETGYQASWWGNANMWPASARRHGFSTGSTPRAGSIAVMYIGQYGHVAWVESVNGNTMVISQYNWPTASNGYRWGEYSRMEIPTSKFHEYIYIK